MKHQTDYLIMLALPERIENHIKQYKKSCAKHISRFKSMYSQGHISFAIFRDESDRPLVLSNNMQQYFEAINDVFYDIEPRKLYIKNFGYFSHGPRFRTIYASIFMDAYTREWFGRIDRKLNLKQQTIPHITIAKNIPLDQFNVLWPFFENREYDEAFYTEEIMVMQKDVNSENAVYRPYKRFPFLNKKPSAVSNSF